MGNQRDAFRTYKKLAGDLKVWVRPLAYSHQSQLYIMVSENDIQCWPSERDVVGLHHHNSALFSFMLFTGGQYGGQGKFIGCSCCRKTSS